MLITGIIGLLVILLVTMHIGSGVAVRLIAERKVRKKASTGPYLALTYDDGPSDHMTTRILDLLKEFDARATFFVVGRQVDQRPEMLERIRMAGHAIGWHSRSHLNAWKSGPISGFHDVRDMPAQLAHEDRRVGLYRPPYGKTTFLGLVAMWANRQRFAPWTFVSGDTFDRLPDVSQLLDQVEKQNGGVILMHDHDRSQVRTPEVEKFLLGFTRGLLELAAEKKWPVMTMDEVET